MGRHGGKGKAGVSLEKTYQDPADTEEELYPKYQPTGEDDMFGGAPAKKAEHFWPSVKRLVGLLRPERVMFSLVIALVIASVVLTVIAPKILGRAMDVIFNGVIGSQLPANIPLNAQIQAQRAAGNSQFADMLAKADIVPGAGIDFVQLSRLIVLVLALYTVASILMWLQGYLLNALVMRVVFKLREDIERKLNKIPLGYFDTRQRGDLMSRVTLTTSTTSRQRCNRPSPSWCNPCSRSLASGS